MLSSLHPVWLIGAASLLALVPFFFGLCTAYVKVSIVLGMLRSALGTSQVPSGLVVMALSVALTGFIMAPVLRESLDELSKHDLTEIAAHPSAAKFAELRGVFAPLRRFMQAHSGKRELMVLGSLQENKAESAPVEERAPMSSEVSGEPLVAAAAAGSEIPLSVLMPAFVLTEVKQGFAMAFVLLLPFLVIDLIVSNVLVGMGMMMVSPAMIALPLKLILFVASDGWLLLAKGLLESYR